ncbi:hypothetical protein [Streptomyces sp. SID12501]|uniref:Uncharacterized protein n=1 Tax=Streptomyces sp. SID12501 TaxID=2706042 RepID=A0A6B3BWL3_9ACTN|nr:hypothetical protein [Streptomyces sp. SID12501]NEC88774.1 hypothetical protein [Streptomyces sp. SID12501]
MVADTVTGSDGTSASCGVPSEHRANLKISIPGVLGYDIAQPEIAHLHTVVLAWDYDVRGTSKMRKKP